MSQQSSMQKDVIAEFLVQVLGVGGHRAAILSDSLPCCPADRGKRRTDC